MSSGRKGRPNRPVRYFIRDDDVGALTPALKLFVETFLASGLPVSYQIIPALLTPECASFLKQVQREHPDLIELGQHGLRHEMSLRGRRLKREFGPERTLTQQAGDIAEGLRILRERLGGETELAVFTPPQHKFDRNTVKAAAEAGHRVFSASFYPTPQHQLAYRLGARLGLSSFRHHGVSYHGSLRPEAQITELSISVDVDDGRRRKRTARGLPRALEAAASCSGTVGLMFHHDLYGDPGGRGELEAIAQVLAARGRSAFHRLADLARASV